MGLIPGRFHYCIVTELGPGIRTRQFVHFCAPVDWELSWLRPAPKTQHHPVGVPSVLGRNTVVNAPPYRHVDTALILRPCRVPTRRDTPAFKVLLGTLTGCRVGKS